MKWLECEDAHLRKYWAIKSIHLIAVELGRTTGAIRARAHLLKLGHAYRSVAARMRWTQEDDEFLIKQTGIMGDEELALKIGCTDGALVSRRNFLGI